MKTFQILNKNLQISATADLCNRNASIGFIGFRAALDLKDRIEVDSHPAHRELDPRTRRSAWGLGTGVACT